MIYHEVDNRFIRPNPPAPGATLGALVRYAVTLGAFGDPVSEAELRTFVDGVAAELRNRGYTARVGFDLCSTCNDPNYGVIVGHPSTTRTRTFNFTVWLPQSSPSGIAGNISDIVTSQWKLAPAEIAPPIYIAPAPAPTRTTDAAPPPTYTTAPAPAPVYNTASPAPAPTIQPATAPVPRVVYYTEPYRVILPTPPRGSTQTLPAVEQIGAPSAPAVIDDQENEIMPALPEMPWAGWLETAKTYWWIGAIVAGYLVTQGARRR
jgi:hypothetical protein